MAAIAALGGAGGFASFVVLAAIVAGAVRLLETVGQAAEGRSDRFPVAMASGGLAFLVAAGVTHIALLGLGLLACVGLELLGEAGVRPELVAESAGARGRADLPGRLASGPSSANALSPPHNVHRQVRAGHFPCTWRFGV